MRRTLEHVVIAGLVGAAAGALPAPRAEIVEEIVAWVNGDIITKSELEGEEQSLISDAYRQFTGDELDRKVRQIREGLLMQLVDRKMLLHQAQRFFDVSKMRQAFYDSFKEQQKQEHNIQTDQDLERQLAAEGMTVEQLKDQLVEMFAPQEIVRLQVGNKISIGDKELEAYYASHAGEFVVPGQVTLREIVFRAETAEARQTRRSELEAVRQRLVAGADFAAVAQEVSESGTKAEGGLLGPLQHGELAPALDGPAWSVPVGELSSVIETEHGLHLLKVEARVDDGPKPLSEVRDVLRRRLEEQKYSGELRTYMEKVRAEAEWCVKPRYKDRVAAEVPICKSS